MASRIVKLFTVGLPSLLRPTVLKANLLCMSAYRNPRIARLYGTNIQTKDKQLPEDVNGVSEEQKSWYLRYLPSSLVQKRGYVTRSYDELNVFDFHEESDPNFHIPLHVHEKLMEKKDTKISELDREIGTVKNELEREQKLVRKIGVIYYYRVSITQLMWLLTEDPDIVLELKRLKGLNQKVSIPETISDDGRESYKTKYRTWLAIAKVSSKKHSGMFPALKNAFTSVGLNLGDEHAIASTMAMLFNLMSREAKQELTEVNLGDEEQVIDALKSWHIRDENILRAARAIYKLDIH